MYIDHLHEVDAEIVEGLQQLRRVEPQVLEQLRQRLRGRVVCSIEMRLHCQVWIHASALFL
jgi:hypothetical protein